MEQKRTKEKKKEFLEHFIRCGRYISRTCRAVGISRWTFYNWKETDNQFASYVSGSERRTETRKDMFVEAWGTLRHKGIADVCRRIGISRWTYYNWLKSDRSLPDLMRAEFHAKLKGEMGVVERKWLKAHNS